MIMTHGTVETIGVLRGGQSNRAPLGRRGKFISNPEFNRYAVFGTSYGRYEFVGLEIIDP